MSERALRAHVFVVCVQPGLQAGSSAFLRSVAIKIAFAPKQFWSSNSSCPQVVGTAYHTFCSSKLGWLQSRVVHRYFLGTFKGVEGAPGQVACMPMHVCIHMCMHLYIDMPLHMHAHIHMCTQAFFTGDAAGWNVMDFFILVTMYPLHAVYP